MSLLPETAMSLRGLVAVIALMACVEQLIRDESAASMLRAVGAVVAVTQALRLAKALTG